MSERRRVYSAYVITCRPTGKFYVGVTGKSVRARFWTHLDDAEKGKPGKLRSAIRKHGRENFSVEAVACALSAADIFSVEISLVAHYDSFVNGYNATIGGDGPSGLTHSEESRRKMRSSHLGTRRSEISVAKFKETIKAKKARGDKWRHRSAEWAKRHGETMRGRKWSDEQRAKIVGKLKGRVFSDEWRAKISKARCGWKPPADWGKRIGDKLRGIKRPPRTAEHCAKISAARMGHKTSEETKAKIGASRKLAWARARGEQP